MTTPILDYRTPPGKPIRPIRHVTPIEMIFHVFAGILLPIGCFIASSDHYPAGPDWQDGTRSAYLGLIPTAACAWPFYPLLIYSMLSLGRMLIDRQAARSVWVRIGLFSGVVLALQFMVIQMICLDKSPALGLLATAGVLFVGWILRIGDHRFGFSIAASIVVAGFIAIALVAQTPVVLLIAPLFIAPSLALASYLTLSITAILLNRARKYSWQDLALGGSWIGAYLMAWRVCVATVIVRYSQLPTVSPSRCYIATAAAGGHARFVGSSPCIFADGSEIFVNDQLRTLKAAELAMRAICPPLHAICRRIYDRIGPILARRITHPLLADIAYVSLKPAEWFVRIVLKFLLPQAADLARTLYRN